LSSFFNFQKVYKDVFVDFVMVGVKFQLAKRDFIYFGLIVVLLGVGFGYAYGGNDPVVMGHSSGEIAGAIPSGGILAFNLASCPIGWDPADGDGGRPDLRGQFIRGINDFGSAAGVRTDGNEDPDGLRALGVFQQDAFQGHWHYFIVDDSRGSGSGEHLLDNENGNDFSSTRVVRQAITDGVHGTPRIADETRPKNIGLIFCIKI